VAKKLNAWPVWRDKALAFLRQDIAQAFAAAQKQRFGRPDVPDQTRLVEILLWEKDADAAWREAKTGGCDDRLWLKLADLRVKDHPEDALAIYRRRVDHLVAQTNNNAYAEALVMVKKIKQLLLSGGADRRLSDYLTELRINFKAKRNFMKMLGELD
jgi:uncharacterized Zn finger protein